MTDILESQVQQLYKEAQMAFIHASHKAVMILLSGLGMLPHSKNNKNKKFKKAIIWIAR